MEKLCANWKECGRERLWSTGRDRPRIYIGSTVENFSEDSRSLVAGSKERYQALHLSVRQVLLRVSQLDYFQGIQHIYHVT
jgi:hypothetical protein